MKLFLEEGLHSIFSFFYFFELADTTKKPSIQNYSQKALPILELLQIEGFR
jgi:hypothetical protein